MHEMGIAMQLVEIASSSIPEDMKNFQVEQVNIRIGKMSTVVPDSLRFCFDVIIQDSPLAGASLKIEEVPLKIRCNDCGEEWEADEAVFRCRSCESGDITILSGQELEIASIEIDDNT